MKKPPYHPRHLVSARPRRRRMVLTAAVLFAAALGTDFAISQLNPPAAGEPQAVAAMDVNRVDEAARASRGDSRALTAAPGATPSADAATPAAPQATAKAASKTSAPATSAPAPAPAAKTLKHEYQAQINGYYCGPAATRIALTALGVDLNQDSVANTLGTTVNGTNSADDITRGLNKLAKTSHYRSTFFDSSPSSAQIQRLREDVVSSITAGFPIVANIVGSATDTSGNTRSFPGGHYIAVVGYADQGRTVKISDPANVYGIGEYSLSTTDLANWLATRGYSS
ncbi:C39 family peptidase [Rhizomonospora bruguierae]|uniref:C39 family peptidase n=1 Tax=Rhizomonospora bruguierae TaxID=1581705 RepID=UPI001BCBA5ED|nr:C39 family peptidase [Micromonospora sp. NBRC 107566]